MKKILIANRSEIALRVVKTCQRLGIKTVTLYADNDSALPHAKAGDENVCLGQGPLSETYLNQEKIIKIATELGVDGIHPGYGFLSENTEFCDKVKKAKISFIGPNAKAIELMGDKKESKVAMEKLGIPLVPGFHGDDQNEENLKQEAIKIGFPVLIKATAGGGGKGMRIVEKEDDFSDALMASKREAMNAFSNDLVLIEKYIVNPRHIEVQVMSDGKGNHFHFFERECSIQRRYQKVIEETPSPALDHETRTEICKTAVEIVQGIDYQGAGTVEFILTQDNKFYFLEMNTRLQVEHPVTEMVTGFDLVELQILAASGEAFDFNQEEITQTGHSIECRIYAEDPDRDFLPTNGKIQKISIPSSIDYRLDCGYSDGNDISTSYDPMLAKVITWGLDREEVIDKTQIALNDTLFGGVKTNRDYLKRVLAHDQFILGDIHTHFIEQYKQSLERPGLNMREIADCIAFSLVGNDLFHNTLWSKLFKPFEKSVLIEDEEYSFKLINKNSDLIEFSYLGENFKYFILSLHDGQVILQNDGAVLKGHTFTFSKTGQKQIFFNEIEVYINDLPKARKASLENTFSEGSLQSPMPGKIFKLVKKVGDSVKAGETVVILEAMKMEHSIKSSKDGIVKEIFFAEGAQVQEGIPLCEIE